MNTIATAAELDALPTGSVVRSHAGTIACRWGDSDGVCFGIAASFNWRKLALPVAVLYRPDQQPTAQPTVEQVAEALFLQQYPDSGGWSGPGWEIRRRPWLALARAVLALLPGRTEAAIKAEALREAAAGIKGSQYGMPLPVSRVVEILHGEANRIEAGR